MSVDVVWHDVALGAHAALAAHLGPGTTVTGRLCARCGSADHGRPWASYDGRAVPVSLARSGPHLVTAVSTEGAVGVDVESVAEVAARWPAGLVLAPGEVAVDGLEQARVWARKEAVLKAYGVGLDRPMTSLHLAAESWADVAAPAGYVAALAVLRPQPAAPAAPPGRATRRRGR
ncbi:4'-phosphopantetheinyl transferase family protein [Nocardioides sp. URHA0020]|uniref:4'-phosphopantetheinyl transferase family protein n=1 Tax=Nocardioides sp. URHA0020 TaxID=1380392 RepID=UPI000689172C|nr:4'-phosphopantetheinyl transferase superfamily protein [Nocardioides sp. URHA0020]